MSDKKTSDKLLYCSFCGKSQHEVKKLIAGQDANICNECIELCDDLLSDATSLDDGATASESQNSWASRKLPTPKEIRSHLDE